MRIAICTLAAGAAVLSGCSGGRDAGPGVAANGNGPVRSYAVADFTGIVLQGNTDVDVRVGAGFSVRAEGPAGDLDTLRIGRDGSMLEISRKRAGLFSWGWGNDHDAVKVYVTLPRLREVVVAGSGTIAVDRVEGASFEASTAGSGDLNIATLAVDAAEVSVAGSGTVRAGGSAKRLEVNIAGSGSLDAAGLRVERARVSVAGSGDVRAAVSGDANVDLIGSGDVDLGAQARCRVSKIGSGSVRCGR